MNRDSFQGLLTVKEDEVQILKDQAESLKRTQKDIEKRLSQLEKE